MNNEEQKVSILLPVFNAGKFLGQSLQSLLEQTYKNIEIIAIDDNSTDNSYAVLRAFHKLDKRLRIYRNVKRYGMSTTLNRAVKKAKGNFIAFMDPHDSALPKRIAKQVEYLTDNAKIAAVGTQCTFIGKNNKKTNKSNFPQTHEEIYNQVLNGLPIQFETVMVNRLVLPKDILKFTINLYPYLYTNLFMNIMQYGQIANLMEPLQMHRKHRAQHHAKTLGKIHHSWYVLKMWVKFFTEPGDTPSFRSMVRPLLRA